MTAVLVAADPGQPYVSPDDLGGIPGLWAQAVQEQIRPVIAEIYLSTENTVHTQMIDTVGVDLPNPGSLAGETYLAGAVNTMTDVIGDDLWETARTQLLEGFQSGESIDELAARLRGSADLTARKATLLARTMVLDASNAASINTARVAGIPMRKGWLDTPDTRTRETHRLAGAAYGSDELMIDLDAKFVVGGFECDRPHDPLLPAEEKANCRCTLAYSISDDDAAEARDRYTPQPALPNTSGQAPIRRAQARQADIDQARGFGELFAEVEELVGNEVEAPVIAARLRALAGRRGIPDRIRDSLVDAAGDVDRLRRLAARVAEEADITPIGRAGHIVLFDAAIHRSAERVAPGDPVEIFRPGGYYTRAGQRILLFKALVEPVGHTTPGLWGGHTSGPGAAIAALVAHLPGKHDQTSHGKGGKTPEVLHDDEDVIRSTFGYHDERTGLTAEVSAIRGQGTHASTYVEVTITDRDGNVVGGATRTIRPADQRTVRHDGLALQPGMQGQGFGARYNAHAEASYREHGIERVELHASAGKTGSHQMVGGYAWARAGFDFAPGSRETTAALVSAIHTGPASRYSPEIKAQIAKVAANPNASPIDFAMIGHTPGASTWPGKEIMLNTSWEGVKTL